MSDITPFDHAVAIVTLPPATQSIVRDALRVRAMDFVQDRLGGSDGPADTAADIYRQLRPPYDPEQPHFNPDLYLQLES